jgi:hypothetical protein
MTEDTDDPCDPNPCANNGNANQVCTTTNTNTVIPGAPMIPYLCQDKEELQAETDTSSSSLSTSTTSGAGKCPDGGTSLTVRRDDDTTSVVCLLDKAAMPCLDESPCLSVDDTCVYRPDFHHNTVYCYAADSPCAVSNPCQDDEYCHVMYYEDAERFAECIYSGAGEDDGGD